MRSRCQLFAAVFLLFSVLAGLGAITRNTYRQLDVQELRNFGLIPSTHGPAVTLQTRKVPEVIRMDQIASEEVVRRAIPLAVADTRAGLHFFERRFGSFFADGRENLFNPEIVLIKFRDERQVRVLRVEPTQEFEAVAALRKFKDIEFAELDTFEQRQFVPSDALLSNQWHHAVIGSYVAWQHGLGDGSVRIAIVDTPFQMNHPDLAAHTDPGWDVVNELPITASTGIEHSTITAGMAAAVIGNGVGVAGASNCRLVPMNINGAISEMAQAIHWAADHGIRIVNISWTGANSDTLNAEGEYLKTTARGLLVMAGVNGTGFLNYPNQPNIYCISMTDAADNMRSRNGDHIDFAAPGWDVYSTTTGSSYRTDSGTSYSTPLFCGMAGLLMSMNPTLNANEIIQLFKDSARDFGAPGWDQFFGWGRIDFAAAAAAAQATRPRIASIRSVQQKPMLAIPFQSGRVFELWKSAQLESPAWLRVTNAILSTNGATVTLTDPAPTADRGFYRVRVIVP
jgi:hypothetical protein